MQIASRFTPNREVNLLVVVTAFNVLPFALAPLKAAALGPADRGHFAYFQAALLLIISTSVLGTRLSAYKNRTIGPARFHVALRPLVSTLAPISLLIGVVALLLQTDLPRAAQVGIAVVSLLAPWYFWVQVETAHIQAVHLPKRILAASALPSMTDFVGSILIFSIGHFDLRAAVIIALISEMSRLILVLVSRRADSIRPRRVRRALDRVASARFWSDAKRLSIPSVAPIATSNVDVIVYGVLAPPFQVGLYAVTKIGFNLTQLAANSLEGRALSILRSSHSLIGLRRPLAAFAGFSLALAVGGTTAVMVLFPSDFIQAAYCLPIAVFAGFAFALTRWLLSDIATQSGDKSASTVSALTILISLMSSGAIGLTPSKDVLTMCLLFAGGQLLSAIVLVLVRQGPSKPHATPVRDTVSPASPEFVGIERRPPLEDRGQ